MAREKAADRRAREEAERAALMQARRETYPRRFRETVAAAVNEGFELTKVDVDYGKYTFYDRDAETEYYVYDEFGLAGQSDWSLEELERAVNRKIDDRLEAQRRYEKRQAALAKLDPEERELLGLK